MLPCMLPPYVGNRALDELVAYRRIKDRAHNVCKDCMAEDRRKTKRCSKCGSLFTEEHGRLITDEGETKAALDELKAQIEAEEQETS